MGARKARRTKGLGWLEGGAGWEWSWELSLQRLEQIVWSKALRAAAFPARKDEEKGFRTCHAMGCRERALDGGEELS